jgi:class 3 adenylate cyclase/predicted ATPase
MSIEINAWLRELGLEQYAEAFHDNDIDGDLLQRLTAEDLRELGIASVGHRRRLLDAIAAFGDADRTRTVSLPPFPAMPAAPPVAEAERRQLTVMFCDLVGSTALSARLDPEDLREVIAAYHRAVTRVVVGFDGFVSRYMGDGVLVYFGYPQAHEDDAERAVRAGLGAIEVVNRLNVKGVKLQARVGIATGLVVVGDVIGEGSTQEQTVVGETPNLAARLQALAEPASVVIAAGTRRLVGDLFEYLDLGAVDLKGIAAPVPAWRVLQPSVIASRFEALHGSALSPLVGRDEEIELLLRRWARAKDRDGQIVLVSGEPGIGKSRLVAALAERLKGDRHLRLRYFCSAYHQDSALYPLIDQLARASGFGHDDTPAAKLEKLEALLGRVTPPAEDVALLAELLSLPTLERHPLPNISPQRKKERTLEALIRQLDGLTREQPVVVIFEDAHWMDPTSRELLDLTIERVRSLPVLLIVTFRPEFHPPWTGQPQVSLLALNRLDRRDRTDLIEQIAGGGEALPDAVIAQIADRTDGIPLFIEELTRSVLENGVPLVGIPTTLHDSLMARLDRLASVRLVAQIGAAVGREFSYMLLRLVSRLPEDELQSALARLVASELVFQRGTPPEAVYTFKHALVQDAAHSSLLRSSRQQLHAHIAEALETHSPELMDSQPELFAQHYAEAGLVEKSVACWGDAGHRSIARATVVEAAAQFQKGLDQLSLLPDNPERQWQELKFCSSLSAALRAAKGQAAPETGYAYARARRLWERLGAPSDFVQIPYGQSLHHAHRCEFEVAQRLDDDLLRLSCQRKDAAGLILGHLSSGINMMFVGKFASSRSHLEKTLALYDPISHRSLVRQSGSHPHIFSQAYLANTLFYLGFPDQARARNSANISEARTLAHPPSLAGGLAIGVRLLSLIGDDAALDRWVNQLLAVATEQGFPHWRAQGAIYGGWLKVKIGDVAAGMSLLQEGSAAYRASGAKLYVPHYIALVAAAFEITAKVEQCLPLLDDALQLIEGTGERWFASELYRQKGRVLLKMGHSDAAEQLYRTALSIAEEQEAKLWELRAATSLARLHRDQGRHVEARVLLAPVYAWFTEGFGTPDLKEAKALLQQLA